MKHDLLLIRHGQSEYNAGLTTDLNSSLTTLGMQQSLEVARQLAELDLRGFVCLVSPYRRTRETAELIAGETGLRFEVDADIREWGLTAMVDQIEYPLEPIGECVRRLRNILNGRPDQKLLLISHAAPIAIMADLAKGNVPVVTGNFWEGVENGRLMKVTRAAS